MLLYLTENYEWIAKSEEMYEYTQNKQGEWKVLIKWQGLPPQEATWEKYDDFQALFPDSP